MKILLYRSPPSARAEVQIEVTKDPLYYLDTVTFEVRLLICECVMLISELITDTTQGRESTLCCPETSFYSVYYL